MTSKAQQLISSVNASNQESASAYSISPSSIPSIFPAPSISSVTPNQVNSNFYFSSHSPRFSKFLKLTALAAVAVTSAFVVPSFLPSGGYIIFGALAHYLAFNSPPQHRKFMNLGQSITTNLVAVTTSAMYKLNKTGLSNIPTSGPALMVANHVSFVDALIMFGSSPRPPKFIMYYKIYNLPVLGRLFKVLGAIPIASKRENPEILKSAYEKINEYLDAGELVVIFPEGALTNDGEMKEFKPGLLKILSNRSDSHNIPIIPTYLDGLWGSMFSRKDKSKPMIKRFMPKSFYSRSVSFLVGEAIKIENLQTFDMATLKQKVENLKNKSLNTLNALNDIGNIDILGNINDVNNTNNNIDVNASLNAVSTNPPKPKF